MKSRPAILRLWVLASLVLASGLLLHNHNPGPARENASKGGLPTPIEAPSASATSIGSFSSGKAPEAKACCDKPPTRAVLMRSAPPAGSP